MAQHDAGGGPNDARTEDERRNPPSSVVNRRVRSLALEVYLGGILALFAIVWVGVLVTRVSDQDHEASMQVETADEPPEPPVTDPAHAHRPGGFDPDRIPSTTLAELEQRGVGVSIPGPMPPLVMTPRITTLAEIAEGSPTDLAGRRLELEDVEVETLEGNVLWVRDDETRIAIEAPESLQAMQAGTRVEIGGIIEDAEPVRVRATRVDVVEAPRSE